MSIKTPTTINPAAHSPVMPFITGEEFFARHERDRVELLRGIVQKLPMAGGKHGKICARVAYLLFGWSDASNSGHVVCNDTYILTSSSPDTVRGADVAYLSYAKYPKRDLPDGVLPATPEVVFEVRSPSDVWTLIFAKAEEYIAAGVFVVVLLDPPTRTLSIIRANHEQTMLADNDELTLPELPAFTVPVRQFFD